MQRYVLQTNSIELHEAFNANFELENTFDPTYNAAPGQILPILKCNRKSNIIELAIWDAQTPHIANDQALKPRHQHLIAAPCVVPISGFYVWNQVTKGSLPFYVRIHSQPIIGIAGFITQQDEYYKRFTILSREANVLLQPINKSMPAILDPTQYENWCIGSAPEIIRSGFQHTLIMPDMTIFRVPDLVNDLDNNGPELLQPIPKVKDEDD